MLYIKSVKLLNKYIWKPSSLSELTPTIFNMDLTHLGSEASTNNCLFLIFILFMINCDDNKLEEIAFIMVMW